MNDSVQADVQGDGEAVSVCPYTTCGDPIATMYSCTTSYDCPPGCGWWGSFPGTNNCTGSTMFRPETCCAPNICLQGTQPFFAPTQPCTQCLCPTSNMPDACFPNAHPELCVSGNTCTPSGDNHCGWDLPLDVPTVLPFQCSRQCVSRGRWFSTDLGDNGFDAFAVTPLRTWTCSGDRCWSNWTNMNNSGVDATGMSLGRHCWARFVLPECVTATLECWDGGIDPRMTSAPPVYTTQLSFDFNITGRIDCAAP